MKAINIWIVCLAVLTGACELKKTESGESPTVEVDKGKLPKYDLDWADVNVIKTTKTIRVPKIMVVMEEREVEVPVLDFEMPSEQVLEERTIKVEAEISGNMHDIEISEVYARENRLIVVSELDATNKPLDGKKVRISDQIIVNAPENLMVAHFIVGDRPIGDFNGKYQFVKSRDELKDHIRGARVLYRK